MSENTAQKIEDSKEYKALQATLEETKKALDAVKKEKADLDKELKEAKEKNETLSKALDEAKDLFETMQARELKPGKTIIKHGKKSYELKIPRPRVGTRVCTAAELEANPDLVEELLAIEGQKVLVEVK